MKEKKIIITLDLRWQYYTNASYLIYSENTFPFHCKNHCHSQYFFQDCYTIICQQQILHFPHNSGTKKLRYILTYTSHHTRSYLCVHHEDISASSSFTSHVWILALLLFFSTWPAAIILVSAFKLNQKCRALSQMSLLAKNVSSFSTFFKTHWILRYHSSGLAVLFGANRRGQN